MWTSYLFLAIAALLPGAATVIFHFLNKYTKFSKLPYWPKQIIYGVVFGGLAIVGTHWSIKFNGYGANARDAAVIIGGLIFGGPAGVIAGTIGGLERMAVGLIPSFGMGFTVIACSVSTFLAGVVSALIRHFVFDEKRPGIIASFFIGFVIEVFHLLMVFVTNANNYQDAYKCIVACTPPMLIANSFAVLVAIIVINVLEKGKDTFKRGDAKGLTSRFTVTLSALTFIAFILSSTFVFLFNNEMIKKQTYNDLSYAVSETQSEVNNKTIEEAYVLQEVLGRNQDEIYLEGLQNFCDKEGLTEINIIKHDGEIWHSSESDYDVATRKEMFNMYNYDQSKPFCSILKENGPETFVQDFRQMADKTKGEVRKYAAIKFDFDADGDPSNGNEEKGMLQFGYNIKNYAKLVKNIANYKNVGQSCSLIVLSISNINDLISDKSLNPELINYETIRKTNFKLEAVSSSNNASLPSDFTPLVEVIKNNNEEDIFTVNLNGTTYYGQCKYNDVHMIVSIISTSEADLSRNISIFVNTFLEIIVFGLFFITIYVLIKKLVIDRIEKTNESLAKITAGNLDEVLNGGNVTEFKVLAEDINETVDALKGYIDAANKRIDEELALAKAIQSAVLPSTFPAFPDHKEFDVFASMHPAKEVGGDFYDFYFSNSKTFHVTIADVSGKGIPAALFMMRAKSVLKSLTQTNMPINEAFIEGNNSLCEGNEAGMFVTAWSSSIDLDNGVLSFANGGHNPPLIKHKNGEFEYIQAPVNLVLAAMSDMPYRKNEIKLQPGDTIYLYTDGVTEGINLEGEQLGEKRLKDILNAKKFDTCQELCEYVYDECVKFANGATQFDDITMLAFTYKGK